MRRTLTRISTLFRRIPPRAQLAVFLVIVLAVCLSMTVISYTLYVISGTAQLDLSRPGYRQALGEVSPVDDDTYTFSGSGTLDKAALSEFKAKYDALVNKTKGYGAFDPNAISDEQLNLSGSGVVGPQ